MPISGPFQRMGKWGKERGEGGRRGECRLFFSVQINLCAPMSRAWTLEANNVTCPHTTNREKNEETLLTSLSNGQKRGNRHIKNGASLLFHRSGGQDSFVRSSRPEKKEVRRGREGESFFPTLIDSRSQEEVSTSSSPVLPPHAIVKLAKGSL